MSNFKINVAEYNSASLYNLASALGQAFSYNGSTGIQVSSMNINTVNCSSLNGVNNLRLNSLIVSQTGTNKVFTSQNFYQDYVAGNVYLCTNSISTGIFFDTVIGVSAGLTTRGVSSVQDTLIGALAGGRLNTGFNNVFVGYAAGLGVGKGTSNVIIGASTTNVLASQTTNINQNTIIGASAATFISGSSNVIIGYNAANSIANNTSNTIIGTNADVINNSTGSIAIGSNCVVGQSNVAVIGNNNITNILSGTGSTCDLGISYQPFRNTFINGALYGGNSLNSTTTTNVTSSTTLTAAQLYGGIINANPGVGQTYTLDSGTNIYTQMGSPLVGTTMKVLFNNTSANTVTIAAGGNTLSLAANPRPANTSSILFFQVTGVNTITVYG